MGMKTATARNTERQQLTSTKWWVRHNHNGWIEAHPAATLGDLLDYLWAVEEELQGHDPDAVLADILDELDEAAGYLSDFQPLDEPVCDGGELPTVEYRMADLEQGHWRRGGTDRRPGRVVLGLPAAEAENVTRLLYTHQVVGRLLNLESELRP